MKILDLFSGLRGWSDPWKERGHEVITLDLDPQFNADFKVDILEWEPLKEMPWKPDVILASPPCEGFSPGSIGAHWGGGWRAYEPISKTAHLGMALVKRTLYVIEQLAPSFFVIENPRGVLRKLDIIPFERRTVWYCHYGSDVAKPTDLWGGFPPSLVLSEPCHNRRDNHIAGCCCYDHNAAPRGSVTGTQGKGRILGAKIPEKLSVAVHDSVVKDIS